MDQVKEYLAVAVKYGFWIGSGLVLIGTIAVYTIITRKVENQAQV